MVLETFSVSYGKASAYLPVIDLLHGYFEIANEDDSRRRRQKILGKLLELDRERSKILFPICMRCRASWKAITHSRRLTSRSKSDRPHGSHARE